LTVGTAGWNARDPAAWRSFTIPGFGRHHIDLQQQAGLSALRQALHHSWINVGFTTKCRALKRSKLAVDADSPVGRKIFPGLACLMQIPG